MYLGACVLGAMMATTYLGPGLALGQVPTVLSAPHSQQGEAEVPGASRRASCLPEAPGVAQTREEEGWRGGQVPPEGREHGFLVLQLLGSDRQTDTLFVPQRGHLWSRSGWRRQESSLAQREFRQLLGKPP